jgi:hypothetical protein
LLNVGQDEKAVFEHIQRCAYFVQNEKQNEAIEELKNMKLSVHFYYTGSDLNNVALGALSVYENKKASEDDMSVNVTFDKRKAQSTHEKLRQKLLNEFEVYFPQIAKDEDANDIERLRANALKLEKALTEDDEKQADALISLIIDQHVESIKPRNYTGDNDYRELIIDKSFEKMNYIVSQHMGGRDISEMTVFEFYTVVSALDEKYKKTLKEQSKNGRNKMD